MFSLRDFAEPGDLYTNLITGERGIVPVPDDDEPERREYQVSLTLPIDDAESIPEAVASFRWDVAHGVDYVYGVDDGETLYTYDAETGEVRPAERIDKGALDASAARIYGIAHGTDAADAVQTAGDRATVRAIADELASLLGMR